MYTVDERDDLREVFDQITNMARDTLKNDNVLPAQITFNGEKVGVTIKFRKLYNDTEGGNQ